MIRTQAVKLVVCRTNKLVVKETNIATGKRLLVTFKQNNNVYKIQPQKRAVPNLVLQTPTSQQKQNSCDVRSAPLPPSSSVLKTVPKQATRLPYQSSVAYVVSRPHCVKQNLGKQIVVCNDGLIS